MNNTTTHQPGDKVYRYVWAGGETQEPQELTVVRINRLTITVRTDAGTTLRLDPDDLYPMEGE